MSTSLADYYREMGLAPGSWHIGAEHPHLEEFAVDWLRRRTRGRTLEIGYQAGGFAVPVILALRDQPGFRYLGIDSLDYPNAVDGRVISRFLETQGVRHGFEFRVDEASEALVKLVGDEFDLILIDHAKALYPRELESILRLGLCAPGGIVLLHDVLGRARWIWPWCRRIASSYGCDTEIVSTVPAGLAVVTRREKEAPHPLVGVKARAWAIAAPRLARLQSWFDP